MNPLLLSKYWAMEESRLQALGDSTASDLPLNGPGEDKPYEVVNGVAILPLVGMFTKYPDPILDAYGIQYVSSVKARENYLAAVDDEAVQAICVYVDSPGGEVSGTSDLAEAIATSPKNTIAYISDLGASAAYWVASQCDEIYANVTAEVGSIGVYTVLVDQSRALEGAGLKVTLVKAGSLKGGGADGTISDATVADAQRVINDIYEVFVGAVAKGRGFNDAKVRSIATGQVWLAGKAKGLGLIDGIASMEDVISKISGGSMSESNVSGVVGKASGATLAQAVEAVAAEVVADAVADKVAEAVTEATAEAEIAPVAVDAVESVAASISLEPAKFEKLIKDATDVDVKVKAARTDGYADGQKDERDRMAACVAACQGNEQFAMKQWLKGHDRGKAAEEYAAHLTREIAGGVSHVSHGTSPVRESASSMQSSPSPDDYGAMWENNTNNCRELSGCRSKESYVGYMKWQAKQPVKKK